MIFVSHHQCLRYSQLLLNDVTLTQNSLIYRLLLNVTQNLKKNMINRSKNVQGNEDNNDAIYLNVHRYKIYTIARHFFLLSLRPPLYSSISSIDILQRRIATSLLYFFFFFLQSILQIVFYISL